MNIRFGKIFSQKCIDKKGEKFIKKTIMKYIMLIVTILLFYACNNPLGDKKSAIGSIDEIGDTSRNNNPLTLKNVGGLLFFSLEFWWERVVLFSLKLTVEIRCFFFVY